MKKVIYLLTIVLFGCSILSAQSKLSIEASGAYLNPTGDFADLYKDGIGTGASLNYEVSQNFQLSFRAGYSQFSFNNEKYNQLLNDFFSAFSQVFKVDIQSKLKLIPIMVGGKYFLTSSGFRPYGEVEVGVQIISADGFLLTVNDQPVTSIPSYSETKFGWGIGAGFLVPVAPKISIDINGKICGNGLEIGTSMSTVGTGYSQSTSSKSTMAFFFVGAGLVFEL